MFGCATLLCLLLQLQTAPAESESIEPSCYPARRPISVDGILAEWDRRKPIEIGRPEQRNLFEGNSISRQWAGPDDASATIFFAYDESNLYIGGEVRDDLRVHDDQVWWNGDCLELFLDLDREGDADDPAWNQDDYQICLMPYFAGRPWGVSKVGRSTLLTDGELQGIEVVGVSDDAAGYTFEARIPFKTLAGFDPATRLMGFNLAVHDHDDLQDGSHRHSYLTINGASRNYSNTRNLLDLTFIGEPLVESPADEDLGSSLLPWALSVLAALALIALVAWTSRPLFEWVDRRLRGWRRIGVWLLLFVLFAVFGAPFLVARFLEWRVEGDFETRSAVVGRMVADLAEEIRLSEGRGIDSPETVVDLLRGSHVMTRPLYDYVCLELRSPEQDTNLRESAEGVPVRNYGFSLESGRQLFLPLPEPLTLTRLFVFGSARFEDALSDRPGAEAVRQQTIEIGVRLVDGTEGDELFPAMDRERLGNAAEPTSDRFSFAYEESGRSVEQYFLGSPTIGDVLVRSVTVTLRDPGIDFRLHGVTYAHAAEPDRLMPLSLARTSLCGAPAALWDGYPRGSWRRVVPAAGGEKLSFSVGRPLESLWLFYNTVDASVLDTERNGLAVGRVTIRQPDGAERVVHLRAGVNITYGMLGPSQRPSDLESEVAFMWEADPGAAQVIEALRIDVAAADGPAEIAEVVFENTGELSGITLFAATGGVRARPIRSGSGSTVIDSGSEIAILPETAALVRGLDLAVFEDNVVAAVDFKDRDLGASLKGSRWPLGGAGVQRDALQSGRATLAGELYLVRHYELGRDAGRPLIIATAVKVHGLALLWWLQRQAGIVSLILIIPLLLFYAMDRIARIARLRLRLTMILIATSLAPIVILFAVLYNVITQDRSRLRESQGNTAMQEVRSRLNEMLRRTQRTAREIMESDVVREIRDGKEGDKESIESYLQSVVALQPAPGLDLALRLEVETGEGQRLRFHDAPEAESASCFDLTEDGIHYHWGRLVFLSGLDRPGRDNRVRVVVAGEVTRGLALELSRATSTLVSLLSLQGFPIADTRPADPGQRSQDVEDIREQNRTAFRRSETGELIATNFLRGVGGEPSALVEVALPADPFRLDVVIARLPLENFLFWLCVLALTAAVFMGAIATWRITRPVEALQRAAHRIAEGDLDVVVEAQARGEVGQLARSFNTMTENLKQRAAERERLEQAMAHLTSSIEPEATARAALDALANGPKADSCALYRRDAERDRLLLEGKARGEAHAFPATVALEPVWEEVLGERRSRIFSPEDEAAAEVLERRLLGGELTLALPLSMSDRSVGLAILQYGTGVSRAELEEALPILHHLADQIAVALENARLYRLAVADPLTDLYVESYFQNRLAEEVDRAQHRGGKLSLLLLEVRNLETLERAQGPRGVRSLLVRLARAIKAESREMYVVARSGHTFFMLLPEIHGRGVAEFRDRITRGIELTEQAHRKSPRLLIHTGVATFPEDGRSMAYLLDAAARDLAGTRRKKVREVLSAPDGSAGEGPLKDLDLHPYTFQSSVMRELLGQVARVAQSSASVLLLGETGAGKEVLADLLHRWSDRAHKPFVAINCSAVPEPLLEAELFGHERGAFTGADRGRAGQLEEADGGTIFLDEVGDMPLAIQAKLLRVLQDRRVVRLGSRRAMEVDVRIVAATNRDLARLIESGGFRNDLYFRLKVVSLTVPPLRDRREDIPALVDHFIQQSNQDSSREIHGVSPAALDRLYRYDWPGNVRELKNVVSRAVLMADGSMVLPGNLEFEPVGRLPAGQSRPAAPERPRSSGGKDSGSSSGPLNERQRMLLSHLEQEPRGRTVRSREYIEMVGVSPRTGLRDLNDLMDRGLIERIGSRRAAIYRLASAP